ncbi:MAG TPA: STAS domain-containing protein [Bryobacteraceae bacterium]|nr:STAS domain-containing protein [Bryobacteraceae bacterium]
MLFEVARTALDSGITVLSLSGNMTVGNQLQQFEGSVRELAKSKQNRIVIDVSRVTYLDSSAIGVLVACHGAARDAGGQLRLAGVSSRVSTIFKMTGVDKLLTIDPTKDDAVSALSAGA